MEAEERPANLFVVGTPEHIEQIVKTGGPVMVEFYTSWSPPCLQIDSTITAWARKYTGVVFVQADIDRPEFVFMRKKKNIESIPTFHFFKGGEKDAEIVGSKVQHIIDLLDRYSA